MTKKRIEPDLESLFAAICKYRPSKERLNRLNDYSDRQGVVEFLVSKLEALLAESDLPDEWDRNLEWGVVHACRLLGEFKAEEAIVPMIEILDRLKDNPDTYLYDAAMTALEGAGPKALEPAYRKYEQDRHHLEWASPWVWVLANFGVRDRRIYQALLDHMLVDSTEAVMLMADYGDQDLLPVVEGYINKAVQYLNENRIDPFAKDARFEGPIVAAYIDTRESLVMMKQGIPVDHPQFDEKVEVLDRQLLRYADFSVYERSANAEESPQKAMKVGRNDPCPCGSGRKYKKCCGNI